MKSNILFNKTSPFYFDGTMSEEVLRRYLSRAVTHQPLSVYDPSFDESIRMIKNIGAKFIGRAAHFSWTRHMTYEQVEAYYDEAKKSAEKAHMADPELILQAGVFEIIYRQTVENQPIPAWVFEAFDLPVEERNFNWEAMCFPEEFEFAKTSWGDWSSRNFWYTEAAWPFIGSIETQMYFYYSICRYIDIGYEAVHLGQAERMCGCRYEFYTGWDRVTTLARAYAKQHARRGLVLFDCHTVFDSAGMKIGDRLIVDAIAAGMIPTDDVEENGVLKCKLYDYEEWEQSWLGRSSGGMHPLGFQIDTCLTIIELDNYGRPGPVGERNEIYTPWGYDDITWFTLQPEWYRNQFLIDCDQKLKSVRLDKNGNQVYFLQPQLRRNITCDGDEPICIYIPNEEKFNQEYLQNYAQYDRISISQNSDGTYILTTCLQYRANMQSDACPNGFNQEETIKSIFLDSKNGVTK